MRRISAHVALWLAISLAAPPPLLFAGSATGASVGNAGGEICFTLGDAMKMLRELEAAPAVKAEADACREWQVEAEAKAAAVDNQVLGLKGRVAQLEQEKKAVLDQAQANLEAGKKAVAVAQGPWYQRVLSVGKWIGLGVILGFAAGMGR